MWIVRLALRRPYTFVVASMLVAILGMVAIFRMPTDIFPQIDIPVIAVAFNYSGMTPEDMETRMVSNFEGILTTTVNDIEHIESQSLNGVGIIKVFFQPNAKIEVAIAQVTAIAQTAIRQMPPGTQPPLIIQYNASNVPVLQLSLSSDTIPEQQLFDISNQFIRAGLAVVRGAQEPYPFGGKQRAIMVDLDPEKLFAWGISAADVSAAISQQNLVLPAGTTKIGTQEMAVHLNASPAKVAELNDLPIKTVNGVTIYVKDVASVRDGFMVQNSIVHADGKRGGLMVVLKAGGSSTLDVVDGVRAALPSIEATVEAQVGPGLKITPIFDQSIFVRASVDGVVREAAIAAGLTGLMILIFLGSWRSTLIVVISIPLSILVSIIVLYFLGHTLNVMTLGGMALAVGILVDDATVEIENIHRNLGQRKRLVQAILDGAAQIAVPALVSTLCICIVFVPVVFISGAAKFLFTPLAMAVVFAMLTSYLLSRTLVPTMVHYLLASEVEVYGGQLDPHDPHASREKARELDPHIPHRHVPFISSLVWAMTRLGILLVALAVLVGIGAVLPQGLRADVMAAIPHGLTQYIDDFHKQPFDQLRVVAEVFLAVLLAIALLHYLLRNNLIWRFHELFNTQFEKLRRFYGGLLNFALDHWKSVVAAFTVLAACSCALFFFIGTDFFPTVDAGQIRLHVRNPPGTRIEQTELVFGEVEKVIRQDIPPAEIDTILDNMGIPNSGINLALSDESLMSPADGEVLVSLKSGHYATEQYMDRLTHDLRKQFPDQTFFFQPADIVTQVLNFGIAAPIDVQIVGPPSNREKNYQIIKDIERQVALLPGAADVRINQVPKTPDLRVDVDRTLADQVGVTESDVASNVLISLSGTAQASPNFWLDPRSGRQYAVLVQTPQYYLDSIHKLEDTPIIPSSGSATASQRNPQLLGNLSTLHPDASPTNITHFTTFPSFDVLAGVRGADLGSVANGVNRIVAQAMKNLPKGSNLTVRGQVQSMHDSFIGLAFGLVFAIILVYLLMVVNFQSWLDPLIILMALPGALSGILWMLFLTRTSISVPSLMGAIMSIGVATSNSILMITFANDQRLEGKSSRDAALAAGITRLRPVIMTALAMIIGMLPMSLGLGEGGEQNAPLGRAVIGGLLLATFATLIFVPVVYSKLRVKAPVMEVEEELK